MDFSLDEIDYGFVVSLETLREVLKSMSVNGRKWWIASDPSDAIDTHTVTIGHGDSRCQDRLNTLYFRVPVLNEEMPMAGTDQLRLMLDSSVVWAEQPGLYFEDGRVGPDSVADLESFFDPIQRALLAELQSSIMPFETAKNAGQGRGDSSDATEIVETTVRAIGLDNNVAQQERLILDRKSLASEKDIPGLTTRSGERVGSLTMQRRELVTSHRRSVVAWIARLVHRLDRYARPIHPDIFRMQIEMQIKVEAVEDQAMPGLLGSTGHEDREKDQYRGGRQ